MAAPALRADDKNKAVDPNAPKEVDLGDGRKVLVKEAKDPLKSVSAPATEGKYDPTRLFSASNPLGDKKFAFGSDVPTKNNSMMSGGHDQNFLTKPYFGKGQSPAADRSMTDMQSKVVPIPTSGFSQKAAGVDRSFATTGSNMGRGTFATTASSEQNHAAVLGDRNTPTYASTLPKADPDAFSKVSHGVTPGMIQLKDLPNRPLTVDEVRALINHGVKPNTDAKPSDIQSKPLNDPGYIGDQPDPNPPTISLVPETPGLLGSPGTLAQPPPENSVPLPQESR